VSDGLVERLAAKWRMTEGDGTWPLSDARWFVLAIAEESITEGTEDCLWAARWLREAAGGEKL
jgi:hypothetical protein